MARQLFNIGEAGTVDLVLRFASILFFTTAQLHHAGHSGRVIRTGTTAFGNATFAATKGRIDGQVNYKLLEIK